MPLSEHLLSQYSRSTRLKNLLDGIDTLINNNMDIALQEIADAIDVDKARGIWLDWLGERLGLPRPAAFNTIDDPFGYETPTAADNAEENAPFNRGPFTTAIEQFLERGPVSDTAYRVMIKARGVTITNGAPSIDRIETAALKIARNVALGVTTLNGEGYPKINIRLTLNRNIPERVLIVNARKILPVPVGVTLSFIDTDNTPGFGPGFGPGFN